MPNRVYLTIYTSGKPLNHPIALSQSDPVSVVYELNHQVLFLGKELFFDKNVIREHKPLQFQMALEKVTLPLFQSLVQGKEIEKVQLNWFQYNEKTKKEEVYFKHLFETVKLAHLRIILPDIKAPEFEKFNHLVDMSFHYKRVTWTYTQGNLIYTDEWQNPLEETDDTSGDENAADANDSDDAAAVQDEQETKNKVKLSEAKFLPEEGKTDFKEKCKVCVNVEYAELTAKKKVLFKLFSIYKDKIQDMQHEVSGDEQDGKAQSEVTLYYNDDYFGDTERDSNAVTEYFLKVSHPEAEEIESERLKLPYKKPVTCQFVEIPDVLFNHNSSVPLIGDKEQLFDVVCGTYTFARDNSGRELTIYGHTDTSGEAEYNMHLSELRAKVIKAILDKDRDLFCNVTSQKNKVEDIQGYLKYIHSILGWDCDPGAVDNQNGPKTEAAIKNFQNEYNELFEKNIQADGKITTESWGAVFDIIWQSIALRAGDLCNSNNPPMLTYSSNGVVPCGEKYPVEAKSKSNYKSKANRRVELVFAEKDVQVYTEPQSNEPKETTDPVQEIVMEPIEIKAVVPKISAIEYSCSHIDEKSNKKRIAKNGEVLEIVPDAIGDKITLKASTKESSANIKWSLTGYKKDSFEGVKAQASISGFKSELQDFFSRLVMGDLKNFFKPKVVQISACDDSGKIVYGKLAVYPNTKKTYELDLSNIIKKWKVIKEKFKKTFEWAGIDIEINLLVGKVSASGNFAEDSSSRFAYFAFEISGGFSPAVGIQLKKDFPLDGILGSVPKVLKKYIYQIEAVLILKGQVDLKIGVARTGLKKYNCNGGVGGSIGVGVGLFAQIGNGKILELKALISSGITGAYKPFAEETNNFEKWRIGFFDNKIEWDGLKGELSWELFDGTFASNQEVVICQSSTIFEFKDKIFLGVKNESE